MTWVKIVSFILNLLKDKRARTVIIGTIVGLIFLLLLPMMLISALFNGG